MYLEGTVILVFKCSIPGLNHFPFLPSSALTNIQLDSYLAALIYCVKTSRSGLTSIPPVMPSYFAPLTLLFQLIIADIVFDFRAVSDDRNSFGSSMM